MKNSFKFLLALCLLSSLSACRIFKSGCDCPKVSSNTSKAHMVHG